jgi:hypothetical protein
MRSLEQDEHGSDAVALAILEILKILSDVAVHVFIKIFGSCFALLAIAAFFDFLLFMCNRETVSLIVTNECAAEAVDC